MPDDPFAACLAHAAALIDRPSDDVSSALGGAVSRNVLAANVLVRLAAHLEQFSRAGFAPFRGGPMNHIDAAGAGTLLKLLENEKQLRGKRFAPDQGWQTIIEQAEGNRQT